MHLAFLPLNPSPCSPSSTQLLIILQMLRRFSSLTLNLSLQLLGRHSFAIAQSSPAPPQPAYKKLFTNSIQMSVRLPSANVLKSLRARAITRLMATNHSLPDAEVLESHIECLYSLVNRIEPSIEAIYMFVDCIFKHSMQPEDIFDASSLGLMKPGIIYKLTRSATAIEGFYNQHFRYLVSIFVIKTLKQVNRNISKAAESVQLLSSELSGMKKNKKYTQHDLAKKEYDGQKEIAQLFPIMEDFDYWAGCYYVINLGYFNEQFLSNCYQKLQKVLPAKVPLPVLILQLKIIFGLQKYKQNKIIADHWSSITIKYQQLLDRYLALLKDDRILFDAANSEDTLIQTNLVIDFLTSQQLAKAKTVYLNAFNSFFDFGINGVLLIDVKRLKGIFEVILAIFGHGETKQIHQLLIKMEKIMTLYPLQKFQKLQTHAYVCEKYGYKSDYLAQRYARHLLAHRQKLQKNRGSLHQLHQLIRELFLAKKLLLYPKIAVKPDKILAEQCSRNASALFQSNIWLCLIQTDSLAQSLFTTCSFAQQIYFLRTNITNLTSNSIDRKRIEQIGNKMHIKNIQRHYYQIMSQMYMPANRYALKTDHLAYWRYNTHARLASVFQLAINHHEYLAKHRKHSEAAIFLTQFMTKTVGVPNFYQMIKQKLSYPSILSNFSDLINRAGAKNYQVPTRDLSAAKRLYGTQLARAAKQSEPQVTIYQEHIQMVELNRVSIPSQQDIYSISGLLGYANQGLLFQAVKRYSVLKESIRMQIQTYFKYKNLGQVEVTTNFLDYPHLADIKINRQGIDMIILIRLQKDEKQVFLNVKQLQMQRQSQIYWKKQGMSVIIIRKQEDIENIIQKRISQTTPPPENTASK